MSWKHVPQHAYDNESKTISGPTTTYRKYFNDNVGPKFQIASTPKNLSNAAVRQMIKENEVTGGKKEVIWPPPSDDYEIIDEYRQNSHYEPVPHRTLMIKKEKKPFEPPPQCISLLESAPLVHNSSPLYRAEPATETIHGGVRSVGDQKWPPPSYKNRTEVRPYVNLTTAPEFRPRKATKDYSAFFAKNALPSSYSGYRPPPETQHHWE